VNSLVILEVAAENRVSSEVTRLSNN
jgi:hypothetical protein